jgi:hypothetical protein
MKGMKGMKGMEKEVVFHDLHGEPSLFCGLKLQ